MKQEPVAARARANVARSQEQPVPSVEFFLSIWLSSVRRERTSHQFLYNFPINYSRLIQARRAGTKRRSQVFLSRIQFSCGLEPKSHIRRNGITRKGGIKQTRNFILREEKEPLKYRSYKHLTKGGCWKTIPCCSMFELASPRIPVLSVPIKLYQVFLVISFVNVALNYGQWINAKCDVQSVMFTPTVPDS